MAWFKRSLRFTILTAILVLALTIGLGTTLSAQMVTQQRPTSPSLGGKLPNRWNFTPPRRGLSINRQGGATRTAGELCTQPPETVVTALVPASGVGATAAAYPTVVWYMPKSSASNLELVLQDAKEQEIYSTKYTLAKSADGVVVGTPGVMSLPLPAFANLSPLEIRQDYAWHLKVFCAPDDDQPSTIVDGGIVRVQPDSTLAQNLQRATPQDRVALYANAGLWYETVATLVELRRDRPSDKELEQAWNKLLNSVGLDTTFRRQSR